ncbi:ABC transporter ATP-binding protein [Paenibacillus ginsengarvi]|uniref:ABC transporter ATP-binding protein n=1 Tax=Paenibacillus ginsengarvi TaxID=400777 RepID=A0A3B0BDX5_9BACL|nr:ABC transporter ATP-binding protein [Paenibacillus ginsengarvi]RKN70649.1 ABC transporter ATP-binding protein [Paenibacillus ginsengarvi]
MLQACFHLFKRMIVLYILLGILIQFCNAFGIKVFQELLDRATMVGPFNEVAPLIAIYGILLASATLLQYAMEYPHTYLANGIAEKLKLMALSKVSKIDYAAYRNTGTGEMIKVIENGADAGMKIIHSFFLRMLHELLPSLLFGMLFISLYDKRMMLAIAVGYVAIFLINHVLLRLLYSMKTSLLDSQEKLSKYSIRGFMELVVFRVNKRYRKEIERLHETADGMVKLSARIRVIHESFFALFALLVTVLKVAILVYGVKRMLSSESSIGVTLALLLLIDRVYTPVAIFNVLYVDYKLNRVAYKRLEQFLQAPEDANLDSGMEVKALSGTIEFTDVTFDYGNVKLLSPVSFKIPAGSSVAIVGLSGSGKSTIVKLMLGLLKKRSGAIRWDGIELDEIKLNSLYGHVSYISQEAPIFDTTIRENMLFDDRMPDEQVYDILEKVRLSEKVQRLPERLETVVGERGMKLSGGERQRLAFGRIIAQQRNVIILDEPVSALDNITEKALMEQVLQMFHGKTVIIVAHRLSFIKGVDRILLIKDGELVGEGSFEHLIGRSDYFRQLWDRDGDRGGR